MPRQRVTPEYLELTGKTTNQTRYKNYHPSKGLPTSIPQDAELKCPTKYCKRTKDAWQSIVPSLIHLGVLNIQDLSSLEMMFSAYEQYVKSEEALRKFTKEFDPLDFKQTQHYRALIGSMNESIKIFHTIAGKFGITPVERTKLAYNGKEEEKDPLSIVLGE